MSSVRAFALVYGIVFLVIGICGFIPAFLTHPAHEDPAVPVQVNSFEGYLFGLFHVNVLHSLVHVAFGVLGLAMARRFDTARLYARITAITYAILVVMGLIPALNTVFGLIPIHGNDVWLHLILAAAAAYFGWAAAPAEAGRTERVRT